jgi:tetratricopeptide (TPR) repeat protein
MAEKQRFRALVNLAGLAKIRSCGFGNLDFRRRPVAIVLPFYVHSVHQYPVDSGGSMDLRIVLGLAFLACTVVPSWATEAPRYEPAPSWVLPAPPIKQDSQNLPLFAVLDEQVRIADGAVWSYREIGSRAVSADALARMGTLTLNWQPFHGDLIIHRVEIVRDGQRIDVLKAGQKFSVIRREQGLEKLEINGILTATLQVEGLRVGDVLDVAYSVSTKDAALKGGVQASEVALSAPFKIDFTRARFMWPVGAPIHWKAYPAGLKTSEADNLGWRELNFELPGPKQPEMPADAPKRYQPISAIEVSSFADWPAVSEVFAPLYQTKGLIVPATPLAQEVAKIRALETDPKRRVAASLSLVQDRVRYFAAGMNGGNYVPQQPNRTWTAGYGDCKAKTLLLLAILHELGIEAEPVLANIGQGDIVQIRLPAPAAFNHIFVHARVNGEDLWLDGTGRGTQLEDMGDPPPFRSVLPVRTSGAQLLELPLKAPAKPTRTVLVDIDESAALNLAAPFSATVQMRGAAADTLRGVVAQLDNEKLMTLALVSLGNAAGSNVIPVTQKFDFDPNGGSVTISVTGITKLTWKRQDHAYRLRPVSAVLSLNLNNDRSRPAWKDIPVSTGNPDYTVITTHVHLPDGGRGIVQEGDGSLDLEIAGRHYVRKATLVGDLLTIEERSTNRGEELPAAELPAARVKLASAQGRVVRLATSPNYPAPFVQTSEALRASRLAKTEALYAAFISAKPEDPARYRSRALYHATTFQRDLALSDLDKVISLDGSAAAYLARGALLEEMGNKTKAAADYQTALGIDPSSKIALTRLGLLQVAAGQIQAALAPIDEHIASADDDKSDWLMIKAELLQKADDASGALAAMDGAIMVKSANAPLLNLRCWIKGTLNTQLESALPDCTRAIELSENNTAAFDSRALVYYRLNRFEEALVDVNAALDRNPASSGSLFLRAAIERRLGRVRSADADAANARLITPHIDEEYAHWKING